MIARDGVFLPSIIYDESRQAFRIWYQRLSTDGIPSHRIDVLHRQSTDGLMWGPLQTVHSGDEWGTGVRKIDTTYRWLTYTIQPKSGVFTADSSDGLTWSPLRQLHIPSDSRIGDIVDLFYDPLRRRWGVFVKLHAEPNEFGANSRTASTRRLTGVTSSHDFKEWTRAYRVFTPDDDDPGEIEFYGAACCVVRGNRLIAFLRVLRDDIDQGIGYTVLAWSDDGSTWERARTPFLGRCRGSFDGAIAWVYGVTEHAGTLYMVYSAYDTGHKAGDRAVAIATMPSSALRVPDGAGPHCSS